MKIFRASVATSAFILLLVLVYYVHVWLFKVEVIFYDSLFDVFIAVVVAGIALFSISYFDMINRFEKLQLIVIWLLIGYSLAISVPTVIDRSLSFYILEKIQQRGGGIQQEAFEDVFSQEYMKEHRLVDVRLTEQLESGTIVIDNGCVLLTSKGKRIVRFSRYFRTHWLPQKRLLMGEYSDDLTDPFRNSAQVADYACQRHHTGLPK